MFNEALEQLERAVERLPDDPVVRGHLEEVREKRKEDEKNNRP
jgi:hypothetical protein